jgi:hypothetical protein
MQVVQIRLDWNFGEEQEHGSIYTKPEDFVARRELLKPQRANILAKEKGYPDSLVYNPSPRHTRRG